jgi:hypothetical protein
MRIFAEIYEAHYKAKYEVGGGRVGGRKGKLPF